MNIKVVLVWAFACIVFLGIGILGYFNQDVLVNSSDNNLPTEIPQILTISKNCTASNDNGDITYTFRLNPDSNNIERLFVKYEGVVENVDVYESAIRINDRMNTTVVKGINSQIYGTSRDVVLNLNVNLLEYDRTVINEINNDLLNVGMVVDYITDYNTYINTLDNTIGVTFTCD